MTTFKVCVCNHRQTCCKSILRETRAFLLNFALTPHEVNLTHFFTLHIEKRIIFEALDSRNCHHTIICYLDKFHDKE